MHHWSLGKWPCSCLSIGPVAVSLMAPLLLTAEFASAVAAGFGQGSKSGGHAKRIAHLTRMTTCRTGCLAQKETHEYE